jgi:hypothetical protein
MEAVRHLMEVYLLDGYHSFPFLLEECRTGGYHSSSFLTGAYRTDRQTG